MEDTIIYNLPESWAVVIVNDDWTGIDDEEIPIIENFMASELKDGQYLTLLDYEQESEFMRYHDAEPYGWLADNCLQFALMG
jgi:hypothetical protein